MAYFLQLCVNAAPLAALYALLAFGYAIAFAVTHRADITYGAIFAFAGHVYLQFTEFAWSGLWLVLPAALGGGAFTAMIYGAGTAVLIGRSVILPLSRASPNAMFVASLGILLVLMEGARLAVGTRSLWLPPFLNQRYTLFAADGFTVQVTLIQCLNTALTVAFILLMARILSVSRMGRAWRAVSDDPHAAELCGVNAARVLVASYAAAALVASIAAVLSTSYYGTMDFGAGLVFGLKVVLIAAAGGHSSPLRSAAGAAAIGIAETFWGGYGPLAWRDAAILCGLVLLLVIRRREQVAI